MADTELIGVPVSSGRVLPEWIDVNKHMNVAYYVLAFDQGVDSLWDSFGITNEHIEEMNTSTFAVEAHIVYRRELALDEPFIVTAQILAFDEKRIHQFQRLYHADGSNPAAMETRAERTSGGYRLTGSKFWATNGSIAHLIIVWAQTDDGIRAFIVERDRPGVTTHEISNKLSLRMSVTSAVAAPASCSVCRYLSAFKRLSRPDTPPQARWRARYRPPWRPLQPGLHRRLRLRCGYGAAHGQRHRRPPLNDRPSHIQRATWGGGNSPMRRSVSAVGSMPSSHMSRHSTSGVVGKRTFFHLRSPA